MAEVQILNYTNSYVITIGNGYGKIQDGTFKFIHPINLESYYDFLLKTKIYVDNHIPRTNPLYTTMYYELNQTIDLLDTLKNISPKRRIRSINTLGKIWKLIAGSPDHDDAEIIFRTLEEMTSNNNQQVIINTNFANQLNNITKLINEFSNTIKKDDTVINENIEILRNKIRLAKEAIINVKYAIQWAKLNVINSFLLNKKEMTMTINKLKEENMPFNNIEEALELASINILSNDTNLLYVIKIPITNSILYNNIIVKPVIRNDSIINLDFEQMFISKNEIYAINSNCKSYNKIKICKKNQLLDLSKDNCIKNIMLGQKSVCTTSNTHHIPRIEEISDGIILLNNVNETIATETMKYDLSGTFLIKFDNTTITIGDKSYQNLEAPQMILSPASVQESPIEKRRLNILSLESLQELHFINTKVIHSIRKETLIANTTMAIAFLSTISLALLAIKRAKKKPPTTLVLNPTITPSTEKENKVTPTIRLHDIPYF